jgi:hypothetical protein
MWRLEAIDEFLKDMNINYIIYRNNEECCFETTDKKYKITTCDIEDLLRATMKELTYIACGLHRI